MIGAPGSPVLRYTAAAADSEPRERRWAVTLEAFERHLGLIVARGGPSLTASRLAAALRSGPPPGNALALTFDGTTATTVALVLAAADRGFRSTVYVATGWLDRPGMLRRADLVTLLDAGAEVGGAGHTYRGLDQVGPSDQRMEVRRCRDDLAHLLGRPPTSFAYPHGRHDVTARAAVREAGFACAFTTVGVHTRPGDDLGTLPRLTVRENTPDDLLAAWLDGHHASDAPAPDVSAGSVHAAVAGGLRAAAARLTGRGRDVPRSVTVPPQTSGMGSGAARAVRPITTLHLPDPVPPAGVPSAPESRAAPDAGAGPDASSVVPRRRPAGDLPVRAPRASGHGPRDA